MEATFHGFLVLQHTEVSGVLHAHATVITTAQSLKQLGTRLLVISQTVLDPAAKRKIPATHAGNLTVDSLNLVTGP